MRLILQCVCFLCTGSDTPTTVVETGSAAPVPQAGLGESSSAAAAPSKVAAPASSSSQQPAPLNVVKPGVVNPVRIPLNLILAFPNDDDDHDDNSLSLFSLS